MEIRSMKVIRQNGVNSVQIRYEWEMDDWLEDSNAGFVTDESNACGTIDNLITGNIVIDVVKVLKNARVNAAEMVEGGSLLIVVALEIARSKKGLGLFEGDVINQVLLTIPNDSEVYKRAREIECELGLV